MTMFPDTAAELIALLKERPEVVTALNELRIVSWTADGLTVRGGLGGFRAGAQSLASVSRHRAWRGTRIYDARGNRRDDEVDHTISAGGDLQPVGARWAAQVEWNAGRLANNAGVPLYKPASYDDLGFRSKAEACRWVSEHLIRLGWVFLGPVEGPPKKKRKPRRPAADKVDRLDLFGRQVSRRYRHLLAADAPDRLLTDDQLIAAFDAAFKL